MTASLAYRRNESAIWDGQVPDKYLRLLPYITGTRILEFGAAEGVLSLLLAERDPLMQVTALEMSQARHESALALQARWHELGKRVDGCTMVCGDIRNRFGLLAGVDTVVAIRTIYHLGEAISEVFSMVAAAGVSSVVLSGNPNRARRPQSPYDVYAGVDGMSDVLTRAGYTIGAVVTEGDPIVTGHR